MNNNKDLEDLKFITELFGNKDLEPEEEVETLEEIQAELKELGFDLSELSQQMETLRRKLAGNLAIKRAAEGRRAAEARRAATREHRPIVYPETRNEMIKQIQVMEEQMGYAARKTDELSEEDLRAHFEGLMETRELEKDSQDGGKPDQS